MSYQFSGKTFENLDAESAKLAFQMFGEKATLAQKLFALTQIDKMMAKVENVQESKSSLYAEINAALFEDAAYKEQAKAWAEALTGWATPYGFAQYGVTPTVEGEYLALYPEGENWNKALAAIFSGAIRTKSEFSFYPWAEDDKSGFGVRFELPKELKELRLKWAGYVVAFAKQRNPDAFKAEADGGDGKPIPTGFVDGKMALKVGSGGAKGGSSSGRQTFSHRTVEYAGQTYDGTNTQVTEQLIAAGISTEKYHRSPNPKGGYYDAAWLKNLGEKGVVTITKEYNVSK